MSSDTQFHVHHDAPEVVGRRERLGVRLLIVADGAFLFGMIFTFFYLKNLNNSGEWLPKDHKKMFSVASAWISTLPLVIAFISHKMGQRNLKAIGNFSIITFISLLVGLVYQLNQMSSMPFIDGETHSFMGAYASSWVVMAGANTFHFILGSFVALGLVIRARRASVDPTLEKWRIRTAASWFTWIAVSGVICAGVLSLA
jgi:heme/copper-type cytochrome/quinol oxidase subunit 3